MIVTLIIITSILVYAFIGGWFGWLFYCNASKRCPDCKRVEATKNASDPWNRAECYSEHGISALFLGFGWPVTLPAVGGSMTANYFVSREIREKDKHQNRLAELEAERKLVREQRERTLTDIKFLAENGIKADVPGLYE
jgi:hypothetical protein